MQNQQTYLDALHQQQMSYGSSPYPHKRPIFQKRKTNQIGMVSSFLLPWAVFTTAFAVLSFSTHYQHSDLAWVIIGLLFIVVLICAVSAVQAFRRKENGERGREYTWYIFLFGTVTFAWASGVLLGVSNYDNNMRPFYDMTNLNLYPGVDPAKVRGQTLLDAGRVLFTRSSKIDLSLASGFMKGDVYCVAPITSTTEKLVSYDFWAVGINCCSASKARFRCSGYDDPMIHGGLRLMDTSQQDNFKLAVAEAEATHNIKAGHPIFFHWTEDPVGEVNAYQDAGFKLFLLGVLTFFSAQFFLVAMASLAVNNQKSMS